MGRKDRKVVRPHRKTSLWALCVAVALVGAAWLWFLWPAEAPRREAWSLSEAIDRAGGYLVSATQANGMFEYRVNMIPSIRVSPGYNILRHAGAIYAMAMLHSLKPSDELLSALTRAGAYLRDHAVGTVPGQAGLMAVWSRPEVNRSEGPLQAKLGGTGIGLVALLSLEEIQPGLTSLATLRALGRFVLFMQKADGSFYSKYIPAAGGRQAEWTSLFYPGEAALGLVMLYEKDGEERWLQAAGKALEYLALRATQARQRDPRAEIPVDHWALLATQRLLQAAEGRQLPVSRELLIAHAVLICEAILDGQVTHDSRPEWNGSFYPEGRVTPSSTRMEGLLAARTFLPGLPGREGLSGRIDVAAEQGLAFLLRAQVHEEPYVGAFPRAMGHVTGKHPEAGTLNKRATEVRIDYVQHALSAMIQYKRLQDAMRKD